MKCIVSLFFLCFKFEVSDGFSSFFAHGRLDPLKGTTTADFRTGMMIISSGSPCKLTEFLHVKPGKGGAFVRTKFRNLLTKNILEKTFRAGESIEEADIATIEAIYSFQKRDEYFFMTSKDHHGQKMFRCSHSVLGASVSQFLIPKLTLKLLLWNDKIIDAILPSTVAMKVTSCPNVGSSSSVKHVTVETGAVITVPSFISEGEVIIVNTGTKEYSSRESRKKGF